MRIYGSAEAALALVDRGQSVKNAVYKNAGADVRQTLALVSGVTAQRSALGLAMDRAGVTDKTWNAKQKRVASLAAYDVVNGRGLPKRAGGKLVRLLKDKAETLKAEFDKALNHPAEEEKGRKWSSSFGFLGTTPRPRRRFARCNSLVGATAARIIAEVGRELQMKEDDVVPGLLEFPDSIGRTLNASHDLVTSGKLILQDKASCFPALALGAVDGDVLDMCAAPGNKTTQLAEAAKTVFALDRDKKRFDVLARRVREAGARNVRCHLANCLDADGAAYPTVKAILLDPSCSGSGVLLMSCQTDTSASSRRLAELAKFQSTALKRALSAFPNVDRVVYSTCSVHDVENEDVVAGALAAAKGAFALAKCLPRWHRRGREHPALSAAQSDALLRADPNLDDIHGFFVALFVRVDKCPIGGGGVDGGGGGGGVVVEPPIKNQRRLLLKRKLQVRRREFMRGLFLDAFCVVQQQPQEEDQQRPRKKRQHRLLQE
mmetsp:Transcript_1027/g.3504  ORF Transcript_1027/g.3504 Transcript_1027/m.3504 type:complete len:490 (-) Transcript_1027:1061-2530(-)